MSVEQMFKAIYFPEDAPSELGQRNLTLAFGARDIDLYKRIEGFSSTELRKMLNSDSWADIKERADNEGLAVNTYCKWVLKKHLGENISQKHGRKEAASLKPFLNKIIVGDCVETMQRMPSNSVDLVVTSPPYDSVRDYKGFSFDLHKTGEEIHRVLKDGGIAAMVIQDQTKNFGKSLTSFRTIVDWCDSFGFKLFETVIYRKYGAEGAWWNKRFRVDHEYVPIFLKGDRPAYFDKTHLKIPSKHGGKTLTGGGTRLTNGKRIETKAITINPMKCRGTIWEYLTAGDGSRLKHQHPATFPNQLPYDFIQCFSPENGVVLDPFVGSGTTTVAAKNLGRNYIGIDVAAEYCAIAEERMRIECNPKML
jgi:site-specific DNA-methyltransferase (adenine-specific)